MIRKIRLNEAWPLPRETLRPGDYRVPLEISEEMAERAVRDRRASILERDAPVPQPAKEASTAAPTTMAPETVVDINLLRQELASLGIEPDNRWGERTLQRKIAQARKAAGIIENKALGAAPENK